MLQLAQDVKKVLKLLECPFLPTNFIKEISFLKVVWKNKMLQTYLKYL